MNRRHALMAGLAMACAPRLALAQARWELGQRVALPPLELLDGSQVDWKGLQGKVIVLEFWGSWCPFCARQNPLLDAFYKENRHRGLEVITISLDKTKQAAIDYMKKGGYAFKAGMATSQWNMIYQQRKGLPQLFVIDRQARLVMIEVREVMEDDIRDISHYL